MELDQLSGGITDSFYSEIMAACVRMPILGAMRCISPVSYTHLDVYKRQVLGDGVARKLGTPGNLPDRHLLAQMPAADEAQNVHLDHSW